MCSLLGDPWFFAQDLFQLKRAVGDGAVVDAKGVMARAALDTVAVRTPNAGHECA
jgi:hypothetical protein